MPAPEGTFAVGVKPPAGQERMSSGVSAVAPDSVAPVTTPFVPKVIVPTALAAPFTVVLVTLMSPFAHRLAMVSAVASEYAPSSESKASNVPPVVRYRVPSVRTAYLKIGTPPAAPTIVIMPAVGSVRLPWTTTLYSWSPPLSTRCITGRYAALFGRFVQPRSRLSPGLSAATAATGQAP